MSSNIPFTVAILGQVRPKKNSKQIFKNKKTGKQILAPSELHKAWHKSGMIQLLMKGNCGYSKQKPMLGFGPLHVEMRFFCEDERERDTSNMVESVMDLLVDVSIIPDDNRKVCPSVHGIAAWTDKVNPRVEISIYKFETIPQ